MVLCPMRGARLAGIQGGAMCYDSQFRAMDGAGISQGINDARIIADLRQLILDIPCPNERRRVDILDTAKGSDSCYALARLLDCSTSSILSRKSCRM